MDEGRPIKYRKNIVLRVLDQRRAETFECRIKFRDTWSFELDRTKDGRPVEEEEENASGSPSIHDQDTARSANMHREFRRGCETQSYSVKNIAGGAVTTLTELDNEILKLLEEKEDAVEDEELENEIEESCNIRAEIRANITIMNALLVSTPQPAESLAAEQLTETAPPQRSVRVKLPIRKLEVKKLSGKIHEWQEFWDNYESAIDSNKNLSDVDKFSYLRGLIEGPAKSAIAGFSLTAANYGAAIALLKKRFGKRNVIQRAHIDELMKVSPLHNERDTTRLRALYDGVETHYRGLIALGMEAATYSSIFVPSILDKLPKTLRLAMTRGGNHLEWTMKDLLVALAIEVELPEEFQPIHQSARIFQSATRTESHRRTEGPATASAFYTGQQQKITTNNLFWTSAIFFAP